VKGNEMAARKTTKTSARKTTARKTTAAKRPRTSTAAAAKPAVTEPKVGDQKLLDAAVEAAAAWRDAGKKRDVAIRAAVKGGTSARQVALAVGLTHSGVLKITKR
jgi:hypothetical protein